MDENKVIRPMDFVRLTNIDELNVIKDTKNHIGLVKEVSRDGRMSIIWIGETYSQLAWFKSSELEVVDNLVSILTCGLANFRGDGKESADKFYPMNLCYIKRGCLGFPRSMPWTDRAGSYPLPCPLDWREGRKLDLIKKMNT